jgi:hypothetical protein
MLPNILHVTASLMLTNVPYVTSHMIHITKTMHITTLPDLNFLGLPLIVSLKANEDSSYLLKI